MQPLPIEKLLTTALQAQIIFIGLLGLVLLILAFGGGLKHSAGLLVVFILVSVSTLGLAVSTREVSAHSAPAFRLPDSGSLSGLTAVQAGLSADLVFAFVFIILTGGAIRSSFGPLLFLLPTLSILLLREHQEFLVYYVAATSVAFVLALPSYRIRYLEIAEKGEYNQTEWTPHERLIKANNFAYVVLTLLCFWLSFYIGRQTL